MPTQHLADEDGDVSWGSTFPVMPTVSLRKVRLSKLTFA